MRRKRETSSYEGGGEVGYSVLDILSTAGGAECTLRIPKRQKKDIEINAPAKRGKPPLPGVSDLLHVVVVVGVQVQGARQGGHRGQRQAHRHPVWEPGSKR